jgi:hypothetical protein
LSATRRGRHTDVIDVMRVQATNDHARILGTGLRPPTRATREARRAWFLRPQQISTILASRRIGRRIPPEFAAENAALSDTFVGEVPGATMRILRSRVRTPPSRCGSGSQRRARGAPPRGCRSWIEHMCQFVGRTGGYESAGFARPDRL